MTYDPFSYQKGQPTGCTLAYKSFYSKLRLDGTRSDDKAVALVLHKAVVKVRESKDYRKRPLFWAQYVHFGA